MNATGGTVRIHTSVDQQARAEPDIGWLLRPGTLSLATLPPLSLYVHFPWCQRKCPYCDFNSHEASGAIPEADYLDALRGDLEHALPLIWGRRVRTVFIGGGTPSLLTADGLTQLLSTIRSLLPLAADAEVTLEANPGTVEIARFRDYRAAGVNRLSIGIQSFNADKLRRLGRVHDRDQALAAVKVAQDVFDNFNLDLMYGLPAQLLTEAIDDVETALAAQPPHLSLYQLTLEPNTAFAKYPPTLPDEDEIFAMYAWIEQRTVSAGYAHYEISAFAQPGRACAHNLNYWEFGDYLGIGAGAASKISFPHRIVRQTRYRQPASYIAHAQSGRWVAETIEVERRELAFEYALNALRLTAGFDPVRFTERTGLPLSAIDPILARAESRGLISQSHDRIVPTELGRRFASDLQAMFLPDDPWPRFSAPKIGG